jgi:nucleotide-binding universal stress UspA family protein
VLHGELGARPAKNILIPYSVDIHTNLALEIAPALQEYFESTVTLGVVLEPWLSPDEKEERFRNINEHLEKHNLQAKIDVVADEGVLQGVIKFSKKADLILMAGRTGDFLELLLRRSLVQQITEETDCPVLWIKEYEERESFWISLLKSSPKEIKHHE